MTCIGCIFIDVRGDFCSIIDGTGSIGAAIGPFLAGAIPGFNNVFYMLMAADIVALLVRAYVMLVLYGP